MSRRNQSRRRRTYGRRQHEVRERPRDSLSDSDWLVRNDDGSTSGLNDEQRQAGDGTFGSYAR